MVKKMKLGFLGRGNISKFEDYSGNMKAKVSVFNLNGRASIWWEYLRQVKKIIERNIVWKQF